MTQDFLERLIQDSKESSNPITVLVYSLWDDVGVRIKFLADKLMLQDFYSIDTYENPEVTFIPYRFNITRSPSLISFNSGRISIIDIPAAIIREIKYLNRTYPHLNSSVV